MRLFDYFEMARKQKRQRIDREREKGRKPKGGESRRRHLSIAEQLRSENPLYKEKLVSLLKEEGIIL